MKLISLIYERFINLTVTQIGDRIRKGYEIAVEPPERPVPARPAPNSAELDPHVAQVGFSRPVEAGVAPEGAGVVSQSVENGLQRVVLQPVAVVEALYGQNCNVHGQSVQSELRKQPFSPKSQPRYEISETAIRNPSGLFPHQYFDPSSASCSG